MVLGVSSFLYDSGTCGLLQRPLVGLLFCFCFFVDLFHFGTCLFLVTRILLSSPFILCVGSCLGHNAFLGVIIFGELVWFQFLQ